MPRSFSRTLADRFSGNRRYFGHRNGYERWKLVLSLFAVVLVAGWAAAAFLRGNRYDELATHGTLTRPHAIWDSQCDACHKPQSIGDTALLDAQGRWNDMTCGKCHQGAQHHPNMARDEKSPACGSCHHDHNGRDYSLVKISDDHCTRCHGNLTAHVEKPAAMKSANAVTNFATEHPNFKPLINHVRHLKFSHAQHMTPGQPCTPGQKEPFTFGRAESLGMNVRRYATDPAKVAPTDLVTLQCQSCHAPNVDGKDFQAIAFEQHCAACHPTIVPKQVLALADGRSEVLPWFEVPHGLKPDAYSVLMDAKLTKLLLQENPKLAESKVRPLNAGAVPEIRDAVKSQLLGATKNLFDATCQKCHDYSPEFKKNSGIPPAAILPPGIPTIWFTGAKFNHMAHRAADCVECHKESGGKRVGDPGFETIPADYRSPVADIEGIDNCRSCHAPKSTADGKLTGGAGYACVECHGFHGANALHQRPAADLFFKKTTPFNLDDFLRGKVKE